MGSFKDTLISKAKLFTSPKLEGVKKILETKSKKGERATRLSSELYDPGVLTWLREEGIKVTVIHDDRDGDYAYIEW